jgi:hypothetical protein
LAVEKRLGIKRQAIEIARRMVIRGVLSERELDAIIRCKDNPRSILEAAKKVYKRNNPSKNNLGGRHG